MAKFKDSYQGKLLAHLEEKRLHANLSQKKKKAPSPTIVSLTSHPPRFRFLHLTLSSLMNQSMDYDALVLWIAADDMAAIPEETRELVSYGLEIRPCENIKSYKKLVPAVKAFSKYYIATADDDVYYPHDWLEHLFSHTDTSAVTCHLAMRYHHLSSGELAPYDEWTYDVQDELCRTPSFDIFPLGVGGVLYPPGSLDPLVLKQDMFESLCPDSDDVWFYAMSKLTGCSHAKVGKRFPKLEWPTTQESALWILNSPARTDKHIAAILERFGSSIFGCKRTDCHAH